MEKISIENTSELQTRISDSLLMDSKTKEYLSSVTKYPEIAKLVEEYLNTYIPYETSVLSEINPKIQQLVRQGEKGMEFAERQRDKNEAMMSTESLQYV